MEADGDTDSDGEMEADGDLDADGDRLRLRLAEGETDGLVLGLSDAA